MFHVLLFLAALSACILATLSDPGQVRPPSPPAQAQRRLGFGGGTLQKLVNWFFPGEERHYRALPSAHHSTIIRPGPKYGPPPPQFHSQSHSHGQNSHRPKFVSPPSGPGLQHKPCNPCNKVPWIPIPHAQFQDGGDVFALVNAPQLHQGLHGNGQPNVPVYHHSPSASGIPPWYV